MLIENRSVPQWVEYIQSLHHQEIELGLERVAAVYARLYPDGVSYKVITVAGTNGKGSTCELLASMYRCAGFNVGKFTSPHLVDFAERYNINGQNASEALLLAAFAKIERARGETPITFFEFGALLAIELFCAANVDVAVMEVGLGGRLDAINILDADVALITSISIDHTAWLGDSIEVIAREKVGVARTSKPCVVAIEDTPQSIVDYCAEIDAQLHTLGTNYTFDQNVDNEWEWSSAQNKFSGLPMPFMQAGVQLSNAALAIYTTQLLADCLPVTRDSIYLGILKASILARCQFVSREPLIVLDVAHNESSVIRLREFVMQQIKNKQSNATSYSDTTKVVAVCGMLKDKEIAASLKCLLPLVDEWHFATISNERGASASYLATQLVSAANDGGSINELPATLTVSEHEAVVNAFNEARASLIEGDTLIVFGSFFVASDILQLL